MEIHERIKSRRLECGLSVEEVAERLGVSRATIYRYESAEIKNMGIDKINPLAEVLKVSPIYLMCWTDDPDNYATPDFAFSPPPEYCSNEPNQKNLTQGVKVPVLGRVVAGIPLEAVTEILDYEELHPNVAKTGEFFALQIKGNSMSPRICDGDVVIVKRQNTVESGDIAIVLINGDEATVKKVKLDENGIMLIAFNADVYEPHFYSNEEIKTLPIDILGKVVELRGKF